MPVENTHPLKELLWAIDEYIKTTNKKVFLEYVMIKWINDTPKEAHELIEISKNRLVHINLIPYNPWELASKTKYEPSTTTTIKKFQDILKNAWLITTVRHKMWDDIDAACGQLATVKDS
jgi:23S rRNA (adenine2503-C2)-methyltransferase